MHISITGDLGSGKSSVAKLVSNNLNYKYLSTGNIQRKMALEKGMDTLEFNKYAEDNTEVDAYIDQQIININNETDNYVLDSRLAWHFVKKSFKVFLMAIDEVAATRILSDSKRIGEPQANDITSKINDIKQRQNSEKNRFRKKYGIESHIFSDFDVIVDTSTASIADVANLVITLYNKWQKSEEYNKVWLTPYRIFPTGDAVWSIENNMKFYEGKDISIFDNSFPVLCVKNNRDFFVYSGNERLSLGIKNKVPFIPIKFVSKTFKEVLTNEFIATFVKNNCDMNMLNTWENIHGFKFFHYPEV